MTKKTLTAWVARTHQELLFFVGLVLLGIGAWQVYAPAGPLVAGAALVWISVPTRRFPIVFTSKGRDPHDLTS